VVPSQLETETIQIAQKQGHFSAKRSQDFVEKSYFIPKLKEKVSKVVGSCVQCILVNAKAAKQEGYLNPIDKGDKPLVTCHKDNVGPMEITKKRYNHSSSSNGCIFEVRLVVANTQYWSRGGALLLGQAGYHLW